MITATRNWLRRNRNNFAIGFGVLGAGYLAGQYVLSKITEANERMSNDRMAKENLRRRFQQNQEDCTITVLALLPTARENIVAALPVESITHELQQKKAERLGKSGTALNAPLSELSSGPPSVIDGDGKSLASFESESYVHASQTEISSLDRGDSVSHEPVKSKAQLWNDLKINSITRSFTLLYTLSLLTLFTRIQLNLLGRRNYISSVVSSTSNPQQEPTISLENHDYDNYEPSYGNNVNTNRTFLSFSWWLLHRGWAEVKEKVQEAVKDVFGPLNPREDIQLEQLSSLVLEVRRKVEGKTLEERKAMDWLPYLLPPPDQEDYVLHESGMSTPSKPAQPTLTTETIPPRHPSPTPVQSPKTSPPLRRLLDETSDLIDSPSFSQVLTLLLDSTFSHLTDTNIRSQAFKPPLPLSPLPRIQELPTSTASLTTTHSPDHDPSPSPASTKLANILAVATRQAHTIGNGVPNEYVQATESVRELDAFAAVIYSSHFEVESDEALGAERVRIGAEGRERAVGRGSGAAVLEKATGLLENVRGMVMGSG